MHVLLTGHTGFKGAWLSLLLTSRGHEVTGVALDPPAGGLYERARVSELLRADHRIDIRDAASLRSAVQSASADVVIHFAAQALVRESYEHPRETHETNVIGTLNLLEAVAATPSTKAAIVITTDKVYRNVGKPTGYVEADPLGGDDPYSASKAMADLLTQSWVRSFPGAPTAIARAGNVIGGGDVSKDRLLVDLLRGFESGEPTLIRYPDAVRPWQHVLDCLSGYLSLVDALLGGAGSGAGAGAWNFGPDPGSFQSVREIADRASGFWGGAAGWVDDSGQHPHEAAFLTLDSTKSQRELGWRNVLAYPEGLAWTIEWQRAVGAGADARETTRAQLDRFAALGPEAAWLRW